MITVSVDWNSKAHTLGDNVGNIDQITADTSKKKIQIQGTTKTYTVSMDSSNRWHVEREGLRGFFAKLGFGGHLSRSLEAKLNNDPLFVDIAFQPYKGQQLKHSSVKEQRVEQGNNNVTLHVGDRMLKSPVSNMSRMFEQTYDQQVNCWNKYYKGTDLDTACVTKEGKLSTPYIQGNYPNDKQRAECIKNMYERGFIMEDCRDKRNFIVGIKGECEPVDFGQVITSDNRFYAAKLHIVSQEYQKLTGNPLIT
ncbi:hypothetical protein [uncultured Shewanella sp.]|uniref:hypothetical protein n=1 Tax=uncultured Shewanella sp. TaxID=173975 RepID=UPI00263017FD|nr:hypothetical protein [uncultured Shewanella sp.]